MFPYSAILKNAFRLTRQNPWLWGFGLFIGGTTGLNLGSFNLGFSKPGDEQILALEQEWQNVLSWIGQNFAEFLALAAVFLLVGAVLMILAGIAKGAVVSSARKLSEHEQKDPVNFKTAFREGRKFFWQIIAAQVIVTLASFLTFLVFAIPVGYLVYINAYARAVILSAVGIVIFVPASIVFGFMHLYAPIFIVNYEASLPRALHYAFNLFRQKFKESIFMALFLLGLGIVFIFLLAFSIILASLPAVLLAWIILSVGFPTAAAVFAAGFVLIVIAYTAAASAAFAVFQNAAWVLAVKEMVRTRKTDENKQEALITEPA